MEFFVNILTLTACFATMAYCYILAQRIHSFRNLKDGMGAVIEEMIRTTSDLQVAFDKTQHNIDNQYHKLQDKIDEAISLNEYLTEIMDGVQAKIYELNALKETVNQPIRKTVPHNNSQSQNNAYLRQTVKPSTLPSAFQLASSKNASFEQDESTEGTDPLADVMPADLNSLKRKKRPQIIIPGEEYL